MKKEELLKLIQNIEKDDIDINDIFTIYVDKKERKYLDFMMKVRKKVEYEFRLDDVRKKTRQLEYIVARSILVHLCFRQGYRNRDLVKSLKYNHATIINLNKNFETYLKYYPEYQKPLNNVLEWYNELF